MRQLNNESPLTFSARLQTHLSKMIAAIKQFFTAKEKQARIDLIESIAPNNLLTDVKPKIDQIFLASDPEDIISAESRIKRELQLKGLETQKFNQHPPTAHIRKPNPRLFQKQCHFVKEQGIHLINI